MVLKIKLNYMLPFMYLLWGHEFKVHIIFISKGIFCTVIPKGTFTSDKSRFTIYAKIQNYFFSFFSFF